MSSKLTEVLSALSVRDEEVYSSIDATNNSALLDDILKANGEEHLYDRIMDLSVNVEEPLMIFGWQNVEVFVHAIRVAQAQAVGPGGGPLPPDTLGLPAAVNVQNFKEAVHEYAQIQEAPARLGTSCLPCSMVQCMQVVCMLVNLDHDAWIRRVIAVRVPNSLPIAWVYVQRPRSNTLDRVTRRLNSLWG